jgi:hypothetical protein
MNWVDPALCRFDERRDTLTDQGGGTEALPSKRK